MSTQCACTPAMRAGSLVAGTYSVPFSQLSEEERRTHRAALRLPVTSFRGDAPPFLAFSEEGEEGEERVLHVPRFYGRDHFGPAEVDGTSAGVPMSTACTLVGALTAHQEQAVAAFFSTPADARPRGGMLVLDCGMGKTVAAIAIAVRLGVRTLVLVHKGFLLDQWRERIRQFAPAASVGVVRQARCDFGTDFVVASIQSVASRDYALDDYGLLIVDEAHHIAAPVFSRAVAKIRAANVLALSATPHRKDGLSSYLHMAMGPVLLHLQRPRGEGVAVVEVLTADPGPRRELLDARGRPDFVRMVTALAGDAARTRAAAERLKPHLDSGRRAIVLSGRIEQLEAFATHLPAGSFGYYIGRSNAQERKQAAAMPCILSTFHLALEALDLPHLDTLLMLSPIADAGAMRQATGRVLRTFPGKPTPLILDVVDPYSLFANMARRRRRFYASCGWAVGESAL